MSSDIVLKVNNVGKRYELYEAPHHRLLQTLFRGRKQFYKEFWALRDVSFEIKRGECIGIIGRNGSGKSTLLQIIAGTLTPTTGIVEIQGKVSALLELGSGFNPEFTGRENVYLNGAIQGFPKFQMDEKMKSIAAFADIGEFFDQPVKTYSSGMYVRLAFAVATNTDPDILIIDEALAVGDMSFQKKCVEKIDAFKEAGKTILFCSHDIHAVSALCDRAAWVKNGIIEEIGQKNEVISSYVSWMTELKDNATAQKSENARRNPNYYVRNSEIVEIPYLNLFNNRNVPADVFFDDDAVKIEVAFTAKEDLIKPHFNLAIFRSDKLLVCLASTTFVEGMERKSYSKGNHKLSIVLPNIRLSRGKYTLGFSVWDSAKKTAFANNISKEFEIKTLKAIFGPTSETVVYFPEIEWSL